MAEERGEKAGASVIQSYILRYVWCAYCAPGDVLGTRKSAKGSSRALALLELTGQCGRQTMNIK